MSIRSISILFAACVVAVFFVAKSYFQDDLLRGGVFLDGQPLSQADLFFIDDNALNPATRSFARTDVAGHYEITKPLSPGDYRVIVRRLIGQLARISTPYRLRASLPSIQPKWKPEPMRFARQPDVRIEYSSSPYLNRPIAWQLPEIYSSPEHTVLRVRCSGIGPGRDRPSPVTGRHRSRSPRNSMSNGIQCNRGSVL